LVSTKTDKKFKFSTAIHKYLNSYYFKSILIYLSQIHLDPYIWIWIRYKIYNFIDFENLK